MPLSTSPVSVTRSPNTETEVYNDYHQSERFLLLVHPGSISACLHEPTPQELLERMELFVRLWNALNSLPEIQGRRIDAHIILGISIKEIAEADGVHEESVRQST